MQSPWRTNAALRQRQGSTACLAATGFGLRDGQKHGSLGGAMPPLSPPPNSSGSNLRSELQHSLLMQPYVEHQHWMSPTSSSPKQDSKPGGLETLQAGFQL